MAKHSTPRVPLQTPMFDERGNLTRTWIIFFERLGRIEAANIPPAGGGAVVFQRTLLIKDTTVGDDIADHVTVYEPGIAQKVTAVLRVGLLSDLTVRINRNVLDLLDIVHSNPLISITIPAGHLPDVPMDFPVPGDIALAENDVLTWDIVAGDGQQDGYGIASVTLEWK